MLAGTDKINDLYANDQSQIFIIEGGAGYGKTAYGVNLIAEAYSIDGVNGNWDIDLLKRHIGFHPQKVLEKWNAAHKEKAFMWDDAGAWINAMDFNHPLIKKISKSLQTVRTKYAAIIFTALDADDVVKKIRMHTNAITIRITLMGSEPKSNEIYRKYKRTATAKHWEKDWYNNLYRVDDWEEQYCCYNPPHFRAWYEPIRNRYADMLTILAWKEAKKTFEISSTVKFAEI